MEVSGIWIPKESHGIGITFGTVPRPSEQGYKFLVYQNQLSLPPLKPPPNPGAGDPVQLEIWKLDIQEYQKEMVDREQNMGKIYSLILV